jgi:hypothetical protein
MDGDGDQTTTALLDTVGSSPYVYSSSNRPARDAGWGRALAALCALSAVGGIAAFCNWCVVEGRSGQGGGGGDGARHCVMGRRRARLFF